MRVNTLYTEWHRTTIYRRPINGLCSPTMSCEICLPPSRMFVLAPRSALFVYVCVCVCVDHHLHWVTATVHAANNTMQWLCFNYILFTQDTDLMYVYIHDACIIPYCLAASFPGSSRQIRKSSRLQPANG